MGKPALLRRYEILGNELVVVWDDGHESYFPLEYLRRNCPCAHCSGEPDLFGRVTKPEQPELTPEAVQLRNLDRVGNYGLQPNWQDGHSWGIWTHDHLRRACPCEDCRSARA